MGADNVVLLFVLVWTCTSVCQAFDDDDISVICADVSGTVGDEVTLTCSVSQGQECPDICIIFYKFSYIENYTAICREEFHQSCEQRNSFTCRFTPNTAMTGQFGFIVLTWCGIKTSGFTVNITEPIKLEIDIKTSEYDYEGFHKKGHGPVAHIITAAVGGFFFIFIIIFMAIFCVKRFRRNNPSGVHMKYERGASAEPTVTTLNVQSENK